MFLKTIHATLIFHLVNNRNYTNMYNVYYIIKININKYSWMIYTLVTNKYLLYYFLTLLILLLKSTRHEKCYALCILQCTATVKIIYKIIMLILLLLVVNISWYRMLFFCFNVII